MFEFTTFFGMMLVGAFIIIYQIYKTPLIGVFAMPVALLVIAYASMFPKEIQPLIPALKSSWLYIHVTTAALGEGILSISFVAGLIYLIKVVDQTKRSKRVFWLEFVLFSLITIIGFVAITGVFSLANYHADYEITKNGQVEKIAYKMPALFGAKDSELVSNQGMDPIITTPEIINAKKLNTVVWSIISGFVLYGLIRLIFRKTVGAVLQRIVQTISLEKLDEIGYRSVLIGFPVFTLGAIIFAMIWAQVAWNRFWGWDPKEIWAAITWLFYAAFLHLRLSRNWQGEKSAWLAVVGFAIIMFNLIVVNLVIAGLHSYASM